MDELELNNLKLRMDAMERRQSSLEQNLKDNTKATFDTKDAVNKIAEDTSALRDIFIAANTGAIVFKRLAKAIKWAGGLAVAFTALWVLYTAIRDGRPPNF